MKNFKIIFLFVAFLATGTVLTSCGNGVSKTTTTKQQGEGKEYTSAYVCPMHCKDSGSNAAGKCPVCEMDYVKNENHKTGEENHEGHNH